MNSSIEQLTIDNEVVNQSRKGGSHENGQENNLSIPRNVRREIIRRVPEELRESIEQVLKSKENVLKNAYVDSNDDLCLIQMEETASAPIPFVLLWNSYGPGKVYDPTAKQQRRDKQHTVHARKQMLLSYIAKEDLGKFILIKTDDGRYLIIDGRQRSSLVNEFLTDLMRLTGDDAYNFWKWFLNDQHLYKDGLSDEESVKCNKILKAINEGKTPSVVFSKLPETIKNHIMYNLTVPTVTLRISVSKLGRTTTLVDQSQWDMEEIGEAVTRKFIDINQNHKAIDKKDIIWGSELPMASMVRDFLEEKPVMAQRFGYDLRDKCENGFCQLDDTNEVRKLMMLLSRSLLIFQKTLQWGASEKEVVDIILKNPTQGNLSSHTKHIFRFWKKMLDGKLMSGTYMGKNGEPSMLEIPEEFTTSGSDILKLSYFLVTLNVMNIMLYDNYGAKEQYLVGGEPTKKFYKLIEKVSTYLTLGKLANINYDEWNREDLPLVKYNLAEEFYSTDIFEGIEISEVMKKVKDLNQHQKGLSKDSENTLRTLIKYAETKI